MLRHKSAYAQRRAAGHRIGPAGLVLCGRSRRSSGADHRPGLFPLEGWHRTLAVPPSAQALRQTAGQLAIRLPAPLPQIGQRGPVLELRLLTARPGGAAVVARLRLGHRADAGRWAGTADVPARAARSGFLPRSSYMAPSPQRRSPAKLSEVGLNPHPI